MQDSLEKLSMLTQLHPAEPAEIVAAEQRMLSEFQRVDPEVKGEMTGKESILAHKKVLANLDESVVGTMISHHGNKMWF